MRVHQDGFAVAGVVVLAMIAVGSGSWTGAAIAAAYASGLLAYLFRNVP